MGWAQRANTKPRDGKPRAPSRAAQRDHLRTTVPNFTRRSVRRYLGLDEAPKKKLSIKKVEE